MMRLFLDANILVDIIDSTRNMSEQSAKLYKFFINNDDKYELYTSCDLLTTVYYLTKKPLGRTKALQQIKILNRTIKIIEFGNDEVDEAIGLMERNSEYIDLEDTIQYVMARRAGCGYIISNDKNFASGDVPLLSSEQAIKELQ